MRHRNSSTGMSHGHDSFICVIRLYDMRTCSIDSIHLMSIDPHGMWSVLQCVAVCCSVLQCVAECCSVLQSAAVCCAVL